MGSMCKDVMKVKRATNESPDFNLLVRDVLENWVVTKMAGLNRSLITAVTACI